MAMLINPSLLFPISLAALAFFPPDYVAPPFDRLMLGVLCVATFWHMLLTRSAVLFLEPVVVPLALLALISIASAATAPYEQQAWSLLAAKYVVPLVMFFVARYVFRDDKAVQRFFIAGNILLAYLVFTAIASLTGADSVVFPHFILDESIGRHTDRARGPFIQAVANGTALTMLALLAWYYWKRRHFRGVLAALFAATLPFAIVATLTRAVWLAFACSFALVTLNSKDRAARRVGVFGASVAMIGLALLLAVPSFRRTIVERAEESGPVEFRLAVYRGAGAMFQERPLLGSGTNSSATQLRDHVQGYRLESAPVHNTYLEVALEHGLIGLALYVSSLVMLLRLGRRLPKQSSPSSPFLTDEFLLIWRALVLVFFINSLFVIMNYQYINALLFSVAGMIRAQEARVSPTPAYSLAHR